MCGLRLRLVGNTLKQAVLQLYFVLRRKRETLSRDEWFVLALVPPTSALIVVLLLVVLLLWVLGHGLGGRFVIGLALALAAAAVLYSVLAIQASFFGPSASEAERFLALLRDEREGLRKAANVTARGNLPVLPVVPVSTGSSTSRLSGEFTVFPDPPDSPFITHEERKIDGVRLVWLSLIGSICIMSFLYWAVGVRAFFDCCAVSTGLAGLIGVGILVFTKQLELKRLRASKAVAENLKKAQEARQLTERAQSLRSGSIVVQQSMPGLLSNAGEWLEEAQKEYRDHAFAPFWQTVENATLCLAHFGECVRKLNRYAQEYAKTLEGKQHNFPPFPVRPVDLPDPTPIVEQLRRVVRMGQTSIDFALIWEQRMTRRVLALGFNTLHDAIEGLGDRLVAELRIFRKDPIRENPNGDMFDSASDSM